MQLMIGNRETREFRGDVTIGCVCETCNGGWMSTLEGSVKHSVGSMMLDVSITLSLDEQKTIAVWAMKTAMVLEATISEPKRRLYDREECQNLRLHATIPDRSLIWLARISDGGLFASGTHVWLEDNLTEAHDGQVCTFVVGNFVFQVFTIHIRPEDNAKHIRIGCIDGPWDETLLGIYPANQPVTWPPRFSFAASGRRPLFTTLRDRWKIGKRRT
ncbi:MAG: hypothetical protein WB347_22005 [Terriglobales bacterium]